jgi:DNA invertase Pin-like site-specific DNA recombinase
LGLEGQDLAIQAYIASSGCTLIGQYLEVESGTHDELESRPELLRAIAHAKRAKAILVIAKLDRLVRSTAAMEALRRSKVKFVACDMPTANEFTIDIHVAVAKDHARQISEKTKAGLAAYKAGGRVSKRIMALYPNGVPQAVVKATAGKLGASLPQCRNLTDQARQKGAKAAGEASSRLADEAYYDLVPLILEKKAEGKSEQAIADELTAAGYTTRRHKPWNRIQVRRVLARGSTDD